MSTVDLTVKIEVAEALVLKPGDRVLLTVADSVDMTPQHVDEAQALLAERFPGVQFTFAVGATAALHQPAE